MLNWNNSPVEVYVMRCCDPSLHEPNYALNLELAEYINTKKANTAREAAMLLVRLVNHRNPHISVLALTVITTLVQNCGYPFHLQISTKEFLNELVRRFPERPPPFPGPIMGRILDLINGWKETLCRDSRFKDDFGNIRDMHRLLSFKGYRFRAASSSQNVAAQDTSVNLKSPEELEAEDREAQSAKLQELIRRGTPRDLQAAQELMKSLAGANPDAKPDYRAKTLHELEKLQAHVILLNDMLDNFDTSAPERLVQGDAYDQVATICRNARPKIQKWIADAESDDPESLDTFLSINDLINNVLDRYERYQKGDFTAAPQPQSTAASDLIDFDGAQGGGAGNASNGKSAVNELEELFGGTVSSSGPQPQQAISLLSTPSAASSQLSNNPFPNFTTTSPPPQPTSHTLWTSPAFQSSLASSSSPKPATPSSGFPNFGRAFNAAAFPNSNGAGSGRNSPMVPSPASNSAFSPMSPSVRPGASSTPVPAPQTNAAAKPKDPFADLEGLF